MLLGGGLYWLWPQFSDSSARHVEAHRETQVTALRKATEASGDSTVELKLNSDDVTPVSETATTQSNANASTLLNAATSADGAAQFSRHSFHSGIRRVAPSVVSLYASEPVVDAGSARRADGSLNPTIAAAEQRRSNQGSGVIVESNGLILTNAHLIDGADDINVVLSDGTLHQATLVGLDRETDLAVVQIPATGLTAATINNRTRLRVGDIVLAIGNPFGVGQTVTMGIVSATRRQISGGSAWQNFVQIDAAINPGNSGGALINPDGDLVGINTGAFLRDTGAEGIGFAIPSELVATVLPQLVANGRVSRGWLGIGADDLPMYPAIAKVVKEGVVITRVLLDSPAANFGLSAYDVVTTINDKPVKNAQQLLLQISSFQPGQKVKLGINRAGALASLVVILGERPSITRN